VDLFCGNLETLPFPDGHFDHVVSCAVLLHLPKAEVRQAVAEFRRVLAKGGTLVLAGSFPSALNPEAVLNIPNGLRRTKNGPVRAYLRAEVEALFDGFSGVQVEAHQMIVLPRSIGPVRMPFARLSRNVNGYCSRRFIDTFRHSSWFVNHHDVVATR
jgi:SAM-dependent methyltransferase